jgi:RimJ/RimL family protein N-acetyltransferase
MIRLEPLVAAHAALLGPILDDADALRFTRIPEPPGPGFAEDWMARYERGREAGDAEGFAILDAADGAFLGVALAPVIDREGREVELGYIVAPGARGRGVGTAALRQLTEWAFAELGALRILLIIDAANAPSRRVAERCGYVHEGTLRSSHLKQGIRIDAELWSRLPSDPYASMSSATRSPTTVVGIAVVARGSEGKIDASAIRIAGRPWSRARSSTTAPSAGSGPIGQLAPGCQ